MSSHQKRITSYHYYFSKVLDKRLLYVHKINVLLASILSLGLQFPHASLGSALVAILYRAPVIYLALWLVKLGRDYNSTVEYSRANTLAAQIFQVSCSRRLFVSLLFYVGLAYIAFTVYLTQIPLLTNYYVVAKEYRHKPAINDEWVYFWFHAYFVAFMYTLQHLVFQRNRLHFKYGVNTVRPELVLFKNTALLLGNAVAFNAITIVLSPVIYYIARLIIYKVNWLIFAALSLDLSIPRFHIGVYTLVHVGYVSFFVFWAWELVNYVYGIYATIGCLDGKKPISTYSSDPMATLLSGLRDIEPRNQLSRLAAFQELAHLANSTDLEGVKSRSVVYNTQARGNYVWPAILDECALVIRDVSSRVNYRLKVDMEALKLTHLTVAEDANKPVHQKAIEIFGNLLMSADTSLQQTISATSSPIKKYETQPLAKPSAWLEQLQKLQNSALGKIIEEKVLKPCQKQLAQFLTPRASEPKSLNLHTQSLRAKLLVYHKNFLASSVGVFFRITLKRDAESRVVNPVNYGNAVIALTGLLMHAVEEDRSATITNNHISEVLNLLERPIRACANYTDILPASIYVLPEMLADEHAVKHHLVALLHDLTMNEFFQLCVKYNYKLNDLLLLSRAFKLAKWVIDASIAQQQKQTHRKIY